MKCPYCNGKGRVEYSMYADKEQTIQNAVLRFKTCVCCNGTGEVEVTNEEWRKTCSTEDFAEALTKVVLNIVAWNNDPKPSEVRNILKAWLKQPHKE